MENVKRPIIALTMGDAAGIGPEIIVKALTTDDIYKNCKPLVIGDMKMLERTEEILKTGTVFNRVTTPDEGKYTFGTIDCIDMDLLPADLPFGEISGISGDAAFRYIEKAIKLAEAGLINAVCTAPLNKEALHKGGHNYPGHTEIFADLTNTKDFAMMFASEQLNVILVTIHCGLLDSIALVNPENVYKTIMLAHKAMLLKNNDKKPRIAVCGINPHAGENGLFGNGEEENKILPGIKKAQAEGVNVEGPLPADTAFYLAKRGDFDIVVAMNHDQGLGPVKVLGIEKSVNITVGLPFVRTSVDHGTAFNIAGKGIADAENMQEAIFQAWVMSNNK